MGRDDHRLESFEEYYGITPAQVTTEVYRKLVSVAGLGHADAEDITQETLVSMVKVLQKPEREPVHNGRALAFQHAKRRLQDFWRKKERLPVPTVDDVSFATAMGPPGLPRGWDHLGALLRMLCGVGSVKSGSVSLAVG
ncbi:sigma factor, partial [Gordonia amicalis]|uniref:sigma factor n=1 Tax=Gordonia amicalis TaxID=89053 RepID=UPI003A81044F